MMNYTINNFQGPNLDGYSYIPTATDFEENRNLIVDLGIRASSEGSLDAGVFSGEEELFAFDRTTSRMTEMQSKDYWGQWEAHMANKSYKTKSDHH